MSDVLITSGVMAVDLEGAATRYRADCPNCGAHVVMKVRRPKALELSTKPVTAPLVCVACGVSMDLDYPEGRLG